MTFKVLKLKKETLTNLSGEKLNEFKGGCTLVTWQQQTCHGGACVKITQPVSYNSRFVC